MNLTIEDRRLAMTWVSDLRIWCQSWLIGPVQRVAGGVLPTELSNLNNLLHGVEGELGRDMNVPFDINASNLPFFLRVLLYQKGHIARIQAGLRPRTHHPEIRLQIDALSNNVDRLFAHPEFQGVQPLRMPSITEFLSLQDAYAALPERPADTPVQFDEKFRILQSQASFFPRLRQARLDAWLRGYPVSVVFIDIDDFKAFNTQYGEAAIDRDLLPRLMQVVEAHVHSHGWAFRFGGDEYALVLPNMTLSWTQEFLFELQRKLAAISAPGIDRAVTVSGGLCTLSPDTFLTDDQALEAAVTAKKYAKAQAGKNCLATFNGNLFRNEDLFVLQKVEKTVA